MHTDMPLHDHMIPWARWADDFMTLIALEILYNVMKWVRITEERTCSQLHESFFPGVEVCCRDKGKFLEPKAHSHRHSWDLKAGWGRA